jgi:hypothetical protein
MALIAYFQLYTLFFAVFVAILSFMQGYPDTVRDWCKGHDWLWHFLSICAIVAGSIAGYESYMSSGAQQFSGYS